MDALRDRRHETEVLRIGGQEIALCIRVHAAAGFLSSRRIRFRMTAQPMQRSRGDSPGLLYQVTRLFRAGQFSQRCFRCFHAAGGVVIGVGVYVRGPDREMDVRQSISAVPRTSRSAVSVSVQAFRNFVSPRIL